MSNNYEGFEALIGFDHRRWPPPIVDDTYKNEYLYRTDLDQVLSVDTMIWPRTSISVKSLDDWVSPNHPLWTDLAEMCGALNLESRPPPSCAIVGISRWCEDAAEVEESDVWPHTLQVFPTIRSSEWKFLGHDIADTDLLSGLLNCGFEGFEIDEEVRNLRESWTPFLNSWHLIEGAAKAWEFKDYANSRAPEHAPFFVHGLWLIRTT
jgi:hypothetical protein